MKQVKILGQRSGVTTLLIWVLAVLLIPPDLTAGNGQIKQKTVSGKVVEYLPGSRKPMPLKDVRVSLPGDDNGTQTTAAGEFSLSVPDTSTLLECRLLGYKDQAITIGFTSKPMEIILTRDAEVMSTEGWVITLVGICIVFVAIVALFSSFQYLLPMLMGMVAQLARSWKRKEEQAPAPPKRERMSGEVAAAICAAIHLYLEETMHDEEKTILTIEKTKKAYSPWASKIYSTHHLSRFQP